MSGLYSHIYTVYAFFLLVGLCFFLPATLSFLSVGLRLFLSVGLFVLSVTLLFFFFRHRLANSVMLGG